MWNNRDQPQASPSGSSMSQNNNTPAGENSNLRDIPRPPTPFRHNLGRSAHEESEDLRMLQEYANQLLVPNGYISHLVRLPTPQHMVIMDYNVNDQARVRSGFHRPAYYVPYGYITHIARFQPMQEEPQTGSSSAFVPPIFPGVEPGVAIPPSRERDENGDHEDTDTYSEYTVDDSEFGSELEFDLDDYTSEFDLESEATLSDIEERDLGSHLDLTPEEESQCQEVIEPVGVIRMHDAE